MTTPGLKRIILLNTHISGKLVELKLEGHAALCGTNGVGKTSLLKLIPFFYGAESSKLCPHVAGKDTFTDRYLPSDKSFIVFEYATESGMRCVAVYRHSSNTKPAYRFIGEGFSPSMFMHDSEDGTRNVISNKELARRLIDLRIPHEKRQIETIQEYRSVLLNHKTAFESSPNGRDLRSMVNLYSLSPRRSLHHLEKIAESILERRGGVERIKQMVADIMIDDGVDITDIGFPIHSLKVMDNLSSLRDFTDQSAKIESVVSDALTLTSLRSEMGKKAGQLHQWKVVLTSQMADLKLTQEDQDSRKTAADSQWQVRSQELYETRSRHGGEKGQRERELNDLDATMEAWEEKDIYAKQSKIKDLPHLQDSMLPAARNRLAELQSKNSDAQTVFLRQENAAKSRQDKRLSGFRAEIDVIVTKEQMVREKELVERTRINKEYQKKQELTREAFNPGIEDLRGRLGEARQRSLYLFQTDGEALEIAAAEEASDRRNKSKELAENEVSQQRTLVVKADEAYQEASRISRNCLHAMNEEQAQLAKMIAWRNPEEGSFLSMLHKKGPEWADHIGKVISPDLLHRRDLRPEEVEGALGLYGWSINLDGIEAPSHALDYQGQTKRIEEQEFTLADAKTRLAKAQDAKATAEAKLKQSQTLCSQLIREAEDAKLKAQGARRSLDEVKDSVRSAGERRKADAKDDVKNIERHLNELNAKLLQQLEDIRTQESEEISEVISAIGMDIDNLRKEKHEVEKRLKQADEEFGAELAVIKNDFKQRLSEHGIDEETLSNAEREIKRLDLEVVLLRTYREDVHNFEFFMENQWSRKAGIIDQLNQSREAYRVADNALTNESREYKAAAEAFKQEKTRLQSIELQLNTDKSTADQLLQRLGAIRYAPSNDADLPSITLLDNDVKQGLDRVRDLENKINHGVTNAEGIITRRANTPIYEAWQHQCQSLQGADASQSDFALLKATALDRLMRDSLPQIRTSLLQEIGSLGLGLNRLYETMSAAQTKVSQQSQLISKGIQELTVFEALSGISIALVSRIEKLDYWPLLRSFKDSWDEWQSSRSDDIPSSKFEEAMSAALTVILSSREKRTIASLFDIEIKVTENHRKALISNDRDLDSVSSEGLSYLITCTIYAAITRILCSRVNLNVHWPVDELGKLAPENVTLLFQMLDSSRIIMVGGFPTTEPELLKNFKNKHGLRPGKGIVDMVVHDDALSLAMNKRLGVELS